MKLQLKYGKLEISVDGDKDEALKVIKETIALLKEEGVIQENQELIDQQEYRTEEIDELGKIYPETLAGGLNFLLNNGFFNEPKTFNEIMKKMHSIGLTYDKSSLSSALSKWSRKEKKISRLGSPGSYRYLRREYRGR